MNKTNFLLAGMMFCVAMCQNGELSQEQKNAINKLTADIQLAPDFSLPAINDSVYTLSELRGKVVILNFCNIESSFSNDDCSVLKPSRMASMAFFFQINRLIIVRYFRCLLNVT